MHVVHVLVYRPQPVAITALCNGNSFTDRDTRPFRDSKQKVR